MRRLAASCALSAALLAGGCSDGPRDHVEDYLNEVNEAQGPAKELNRLASIYRRVALGDVAVAKAADRLADAERSLGETHERLEQIVPPAEAEELHAKLVRAFRLNVAMAHETTLLARFVPKVEETVQPLDEANRKMSVGLESGDPATQARALDRFAEELGGVITQQRKLEPPPVMERAYRSRVTQLVAVRALAIKLRDALRRQDAAAVSVLLTRFARAASKTPPAGLDKRSVRAYRDRYRELAEATRAVRAEESQVRRVIVED